MIGEYTKKLEGDHDDDVAKWMAKIDRAIRVRKEEEKAWDQNEDFVDLKQWGGEKGEGDQVTVNKLAAYMRTFRASVAYRNPRAKIRPTTQEGYAEVQVPVMDDFGRPARVDPQDPNSPLATRPVLRYKLREALLNDIIGKPLFGLSKTMSRLSDSAIMSYGVLKVGYDPSFATQPEPDTKEEVGIPLNPDGTPDTSAFMVNPATGEPYTDDNGNYIKKDRVPSWEEWFIDWVNPHHMLHDPDGENDFMQHRWVGQEIIRPLDDVKADPLFKNTDDLKSGLIEKDPRDMDIYSGVPEWAGDDELSRDKLVRLFEIFDRVNNRLIVLADGHGKKLRDIVVPLGISRDPYSFLIYNDARMGSFYQRPPASDLVPLNQEYNTMRRYQMQAGSHAARKVITKKGALDEHNKDVLASDDDMAIVEIKPDVAYSIADSIAPFTPPPVSETLWNNIQFIARDIDEVGGLPIEARGGASKGTATGINQIAQHVGARFDFDREQFADCLVIALKKLNDSIDANMTKDRAVHLEGADGQAFVAIVDRQMIACDCDIEIDVTEMAPENDQMLVAHRLQLAQVAAQAPWLFADEVSCRGWCEMLKIVDERFIKALSGMAQAQMQMEQMQTQAKSPEAGPPGSPADMLAQAGAGGQIPRQQGAR